MLSSIIYSVSTLLVAGLVYGSPAIPVKRQDIGTASFVIDDEHCKREQKDKDLLSTELGIASDIAKAAAGAKLNADNKWSKYVKMSRPAY